jgi:activator of HSP90 ATPase
MKSLKQTYKIHAPILEVWKALVDPKYIRAWGAGPLSMSEEIGEKFELWGGEIWGKNIEVESQKKLVQEWYSGDKWEKPSIVSFELFKDDSGTRLDLTHKNIPDAEFEEVDNGWKIYYLGPIKKYLEKKNK